jgi:hypothetical protein
MTKVEQKEQFFSIYEQLTRAKWSDKKKQKAGQEAKLAKQVKRFPRLPLTMTPVSASTAKPSYWTAHCPPE